MVSVPWSTSVFPAGKDIPTLLQFIMGRGRPSASQTTWQVVRFTGVASDGGTLVKVVTDSVNNLTDRIKVYNGQFVARTAYNRLSDAYN